MCVRGKKSINHTRWRLARASRLNSVISVQVHCGSTLWLCIDLAPLENILGVLCVEWPFINVYADVKFQFEYVPTYSERGNKNISNFSQNSIILGWNSSYRTVVELRFYFYQRNIKRNCNFSSCYRLNKENRIKLLIIVKTIRKFQLIMIQYAINYSLHGIEINIIAI